MTAPHTQCPLWLEFSGLPEFINGRNRRGAWSLFKKIVELDCARNRAPGVVEISLKDLADRVGLSIEHVEKYLEWLRKKKLVACFIPDNEEEEALLRVATKLKTPVPPRQLKDTRPDIFPPGRDFFRYFDKEEEDSKDDHELKEIVDIYFNAVGLRMNLFILDELRVMRQRFKLVEIKKAFDLARRLDKKSMKFVMNQLISGKKKDAQEKSDKKTGK